MSAIDVVEKAQLAQRPQMKSGDTVKVHVKVRELRCVAPQQRAEA